MKYFQDSCYIIINVHARARGRCAVGILQKINGKNAYKFEYNHLYLNKSLSKSRSLFNNIHNIKDVIIYHI